MKQKLILAALIGIFFITSPLYAKTQESCEGGFTYDYGSFGMLSKQNYNLCPNSTITFKVPKTQTFYLSGIYENAAQQLVLTVGDGITIEYNNTQTNSTCRNSGTDKSCTSFSFKGTTGADDEYTLQLYNPNNTPVMIENIES